MNKQQTKQRESAFMVKHETKQHPSKESNFLLHYKKDSSRLMPYMALAQTSDRINNHRVTNLQLIVWFEERPAEPVWYIKTVNNKRSLKGFSSWDF